MFTAILPQQGFIAQAIAQFQAQFPKTARVQAKAFERIYEVINSGHVRADTEIGAYFINVGTGYLVQHRECDCGHENCYHRVWVCIAEFAIAAEFAAKLAHAEVIAEEQDPTTDEHAEHGEWHGKTCHYCGDGTVVEKIGYSRKQKNHVCRHCKQEYCAACDTYPHTQAEVQP